MYYPIFLSVVFVVNLYALIPSSIRNLHRDDTRHVRWRCFSVLISTAVALVTFTKLFCETDSSSWDRLGFERWDISIPFIHILFLYLGPISVWAMEHHLACASFSANSSGSYLGTILLTIIETITSPLNIRYWSWVNWRNLFLAPLAEEIIFRSCSLPPLLSSGMSVGEACLFSSLCFGLAHTHHAFSRWRDGFPWRAIFLQTLFQFVFTSLFGSYVAFVHCRRASLPASVTVHIFCNIWGLPDLTFFIRWGRGSIYRRVILRGVRYNRKNSSTMLNDRETNEEIVIVQTTEWMRFLGGTCYIVGIILFGLLFIADPKVYSLAPFGNAEDFVLVSISR